MELKVREVGSWGTLCANSAELHSMGRMSCTLTCRLNITPATYVKGKMDYLFFFQIMMMSKIRSSFIAVMCKKCTHCFLIVFSYICGQAAPWTIWVLQELWWPGGKFLFFFFGHWDLYVYIPITVLIIEHILCTFYRATFAKAIFYVKMSPALLKSLLSSSLKLKWRYLLITIYYKSVCWPCSLQTFRVKVVTCIHAVVV